MAFVWNEETAAHLYRRAAFGGTSDEIRRAVAEGRDATVNRLLLYTYTPNDALDARIDAQHFYLASDGLLSDLARWFLLHLMFTARPLQERMTLLWHDHFATLYSKVLHIGWLKTENEVLRSFGLGKFRDLMTQIAKDNAMEYFLDQWMSTRTQPNENFGREFCELFTLGVGHYAEADVKAAVMAFTGWSIEGTLSTFLFNADQHDYSQKTFLGQTGAWDGEDVIRIACSQFAHGQRIATKVFSYFAYDNPEQDVVDRFARTYLDNDTDLSALVRAILLSDEMYSSKALWNKVKSPIDHAVIATRQLLLQDDATGTFQYLVQGGQTPFDPPDVSGWQGGTNWISPSALLNRMNLADAITRAFDPLAFTNGESIHTPDDLVDVYLRKLGPLAIPAATRSTLLNYVGTNTTSISRQRGLARMILSLPEWQMY
jgi:uncharacterized protein (DUF1800 family)